MAVGLGRADHRAHHEVEGVRPAVAGIAAGSGFPGWRRAAGAAGVADAPRWSGLLARPGRRDRRARRQPQRAIADHAASILCSFLPPRSRPSSPPAAALGANDPNGPACCSLSLARCRVGRGHRAPGGAARCRENWSSRDLGSLIASILPLVVDRRRLPQRCDRLMSVPVRLRRAAGAPAPPTRPRAACPAGSRHSAIPVARVGGIASRAMQIGMDAGADQVVLGLGALMRPVPVALGHPPQPWMARLRPAGGSAPVSDALKVSYPMLSRPCRRPAG